MTKRLINALFNLVIVTTIILLIVLLRLIKVLDICCTFLDIIIPIFFGYVLAWILKPIQNKISTRIGKTPSFLIIIAGLILLYASLIALILPIIISEFGNFIGGAKDYIKVLNDIPFVNIDTSNIELNLNTVLESCGGVLSIVIKFALINMFGFYILFNYDLVNIYTKKIIPKKYKNLMVKFSKLISKNMHLFIKATIVDTCIMFIMVLICFLIFGFKYSILLAIFIAITNIIPFVGPYIGGAPAVLLGFATSIKLGIIALLIVLICQLIESNLINPLIMSKVTKINPLLIVITITIMGKFLGIIGMALAVPLLILIKLSYEFIMKNKSLIKLQNFN